MPGSQFLPEDIENGVIALLNGMAMADGSKIHVGSLGDLNLNDDGELIFDPPMARTYYEASRYETTDSTMTNYNCEHLLQVWCYAQNLKSKQQQREQSKLVLGQALVRLAGTRVAVTGGTSEPIAIVDANGVLDKQFGKSYALRISVYGIAQFPGPQ